MRNTTLSHGSGRTSTQFGEPVIDDKHVGASVPGVAPRDLPFMACLTSVRLDEEFQMARPALSIRLNGRFSACRRTFHDSRTSFRRDSWILRSSWDPRQVRRTNFLAFRPYWRLFYGAFLAPESTFSFPSRRIRPRCLPDTKVQRISMYSPAICVWTDVRIAYDFA